MKKAYLGIDLGTTSVKCMAIDEKGYTLAVKSAPYKSYSPHSGWMEQEPEEWMEAVYQCVRNCLSRLSGYEIAAVSFSGHMSSPVFLGDHGKPLRRCITVADTRSYVQSSWLSEKYLDRFKQLCGNYPADCFIAAKILWLKEEEPENYEKTRVFLCAKDYVRWRLTGEMNTDPTDAGNTALYDFKERRWAMDFIRELGLNPAIFPEIKPSMEVVGCINKETEEKTGLRSGTPVVCGGADMACSQLGTGAVEKGCTAITLGTSGQICTRVDGIIDQGIGKETFHLGVTEDHMYTMATIFSGGLSVNWIYEKMFDKQGIKEEDFKEMAILAKQSERVPVGANGHLFLPFLTGSASPYFDSRDRACITGLSSASSKPELFRAVLEGVAYHLLENIHVFQQMGCEVKKIRLGGGGAKIPLWGQIIADVLGNDLEILEISDASALGACMIARAGITGQSIEKAASQEIKIQKIFTCDIQNHHRYKELFDLYQELYGAIHQIQAKYYDFITRDGGNGLRNQL